MLLSIEREDRRVPTVALRGQRISAQQLPHATGASGAFYEGKDELRGL